MSGENVLAQLLGGEGRDYIVDKKGNQTPIASLQGKIVGVYSSASWCSPCRSFTPWLNKFYKKVRADGKEFEIVWASSDQRVGDYKRYHKKMPWKSIPFEDRKAAQAVSKALGAHMPGFALFDENGALILLSARNRIRKLGPAGYPWKSDQMPEKKAEKKVEVKRVAKTEEEWKAELTELEYKVLREKHTEESGQGKYVNSLPTKGHYKCRGCNQPLYSAMSKFDSGCGWPAFDACYRGAVGTRVDSSFGMTRVEIICTGCEGHLGHVFNGEKHSDTDERHCVNSIGIVYDASTPPGDLTEETVGPAPAPQEEEKKE